MEVVADEFNCVDYSRDPSKIFVLKLKALKHRLIGWNRYSGGSLKASLEACSKRRVNELDLLEEERGLNSLENEERLTTRKGYLL